MKEIPYKFINMNDPLSIFFSSHKTYLSIYNAHFFLDFYNDDLFNKYKIFPISKLHEISKKRKAEYLAGRIVASWALNGLKKTTFNLVSDETGCPIWPKNVVGSISHSDNIAIACVIQNNKTFYSSIGIDIEPVIPTKVAESIANRIVTDKEIYYIQKILKCHFSVALTLLFSAKESIYKALFSMLKIEVSFLNIRFIGINENILRFTLNNSLNIKHQLSSIIQVYYLIDEQSILTATLL